jgi:hypothetical protein
MTPGDRTNLEYLTQLPSDGRHTNISVHKVLLQLVMRVLVEIR